MLGSIAKFGSAADMDGLFEKELQVKGSSAKEVAMVLSTLEEAASRDVKPAGNLDRITDFIDSDDETIVDKCHSTNWVVAC